MKKKKAAKKAKRTKATADVAKVVRFVPHRKVCAFCVDKIEHIDYKDVSRLQRFLSDRAKIEPRRKTGTCARHQRRLTVALKRARFMALLPYTSTQLL